jgi:hypothetical protein
MTKKKETKEFQELFNLTYDKSYKEIEREKLEDVIMKLAYARCKIFKLFEWLFKIIIHDKKIEISSSELKELEGKVNRTTYYYWRNYLLFNNFLNYTNGSYKITSHCLDIINSPKFQKHLLLRLKIEKNQNAKR